MIYTLYFVPLLFILIGFSIFLAMEWWNGKPIKSSDIVLWLAAFIPLLNAIFVIVILTEMLKNDSVVIKGRGQ
jgi:uncharacterized membrane protein